MDRTDDEIILYSFLREEIKREDDITNRRLTSACTFQGFLIASMAFALNGAWPTLDNSNFYSELIQFRVAVLGGLGVIGLSVAITSAFGVYASRRSVASVISAWEGSGITKDSRLPQAYGDKGGIALGHSFATLTALWFVFMWATYLTIFIGFIF